MSPSPGDIDSDVFEAVQRAIQESEEAKRFGFRVIRDPDEFQWTSAGIEVPISYDVDAARASELENALRSIQDRINSEFPDEYINLFLYVYADDE